MAGFDPSTEVHPEHSVNGYFFVHYTGLGGDSEVARYSVSADPNVADGGSALSILTIAQPFTNHNGGQLHFGQDGFLYVAVGDGGSSADPQDNGQDLDTLLGKLLRLDVDGGAPYAIPPDNPFVGTPGARGEIWALGLRNPWRFSFDRATGDLFIGDVGQNAWEEVNYQPASSGGDENYGWRLMEGLHCFNPATGCNDGTLALPILEYAHGFDCSITGGYRYRGASLSVLDAAYVYGDYCSGRIWSASLSGGRWTSTELLNTEHLISTFGEDESGELYVASYATTTGAVYKIGLAPTPSVETLSITRLGTGTGSVTSDPVGISCGMTCDAAYDTDTVVTLTAMVDPGSQGGTFGGHPDCADAVVTLALARTCTVTFSLAFTDDPPVAGLTNIKAVHFAELRARINAIRLALGLSAFVWTDDPLVSQSTVIRAAHLTELRAALGQAYGAAGAAAPVYTDPVIAVGQTAKAAHLAELRVAVVALE